MILALKGSSAADEIAAADVSCSCRLKLRS